MEAYIPDSDSRKQAVVEFFANSGQQFLPILPKPRRRGDGRDAVDDDPAETDGQ